GRITDDAVRKAIERGPIDLSQGKWDVVKAAGDTLPLPGGKGTAYEYFRIQSRDRQPALVTGVAGSLWHNGRLIEDRAEGAVLLDLQPGSNDILVGISGIFPVSLQVRAKGAVSLSLPEKTDGAALAERLKAAKGTPV